MGGDLDGYGLRLRLIVGHELRPGHGLASQHLALAPPHPARRAALTPTRMSRVIAWSTRCSNRPYGPSSRTVSPAAASTSAASARFATWVFHEMPSAPPGLSSRTHPGIASLSSCIG